MIDRLLTLDQVTEATGFKRSKIYALIGQGRFPAPIKIDSASRWAESAIAAWTAAQIAASEQ